MTENDRRYTIRIWQYYEDKLSSISERRGVAITALIKDCVSSAIDEGLVK